MKETIYYQFFEFGKIEPRYVDFRVNESYLMIRVTLQSDGVETKDYMTEFKGWQIENLYGLRDQVIFGNQERFSPKTRWRNFVKKLKNKR